MRSRILAHFMPEPVLSRPELSRDLGVSHASAVVVGTIIGSGIFLVPAEMMQAVGSAKLVYLAWIVGGVLSFAGALTYAELGAMKPQTGGEYVYVRDAYGPLGGFLYAWTWFVIAKPASIATIVTGLVRILGTFPIFSFFSLNAINAPLAVTWGQIFAIAAAVLVSFLNYLGVKKAGEFQLVFTLLKVAIILGIVVVCFSGIGNSAGRGWSNFAGTFAGAKGGIAGFMAALVAALWAYDGWNDLNMVAGEVKNPERNIPVALDRGRGGRGTAIRAGQRRSAVRASRRRHRGISTPGFRCSRAGDGESGSEHCVGGHGAVDACGFERHHHERCSRTVRGGPGRIFLPRARRGASAVSYSVRGAFGASVIVDSAVAAGCEFSAAFFAGDFRRMALLHDRRQHNLCLSRTRATDDASISHVGLSFRAGGFRGGGGGIVVLHVQE